jgi:hypothetical protein
MGATSLKVSVEGCRTMVSKIIFLFFGFRTETFSKGVPDWSRKVFGIFFAPKNWEAVPG